MVKTHPKCAMGGIHVYDSIYCIAITSMGVGAMIVTKTMHIQLDG